MRAHTFELVRTLAGTGWDDVRTRKRALCDEGLREYFDIPRSVNRLWVVVTPRTGASTRPPGALKIRRSDVDFEYYRVEDERGNMDRVYFMLGARTLLNAVFAGIRTYWVSVEYE